MGTIVRGDNNQHAAAAVIVLPFQLITTLSLPGGVARGNVSSAWPFADGLSPCEQGRRSPTASNAVWKPRGLERFE
jgi:hypothetical protein